MSAESALLRQTILFSGRVQGVGFRATTRELSQDFAVTGYVRNLPDGRVEAVAEGERAALEGFLGAIRAAFTGYIRDVQVTTSAALGNLRAFEIRH